MNRWAFWFLSTLLIAVIVHFSYVLFAPRPKLEQMMADFHAIAGEGEFKVLAVEEARRLLPMEGPALVHAVCAFDVAAGPAEANLPITPGYWSVAVVTEDGRNAYLLNDRQAGVEALTLVLRRKDESAARQSAEASGQAAIDPRSTANRIYIDLAVPRGVIVLRALPKFEAERALIARGLARSTCKAGTV